MNNEVVSFLEQFENDLKTLHNDDSQPSWMFRFEVTVNAATEEEAIRLGKIDCVYENGIISAVKQ